jgi:steroid delta-isomerase-like uncharacterized protein
MQTPVDLESIRNVLDESWNGCNLQALDQMIAADYTPHHSLNPVLGPEGVKQFVASMQRAFPDLEFNVEDMVSAGDKVVLRWSIQGTHNHELMGIPPSRKRVRLTGISIYRIQGDQVTESWDEVDVFNLLYQIGALTK